ncbi:MAG: PAS domain S-box protein [Acidobacteriota bacterium]|nr:PAS domain S-box protein [Acidobacteriota bacterium]
MRARVAELEEQLSSAAKGEAAPLESRELFEAFMSNSPMLAYLKEESGKYLYANRAVDLLFGDGYGKWRGNSDGDIWPVETAEEIRRQDLFALEQNRMVQCTEVLPWQEGSRHFLTFRFPFTDSSGSRYLAGISVDVTDRVHLEQERGDLLKREQQARVQAEQTLSVLRHTEQRFRSLFDSNVIGIFEVNEECVLDANASFLEMTGQSRDVVLTGALKWRDMTPAKYHRMDQFAHERAIREGSFPPYEKEFYRKDGSVVPVWVGGVRLSGPPDWTCMAFVLDLSERKLLEKQFLVAQKLKSLGLLSGIIAHDFNNLLTTMIGNASLALDAVTPEHPAFGLLGEVLRASRLASDLTSQLVGYSGKPRAATNAVDVSQLVREISELVEMPLSPNVAMRWNLGKNLPLVSGDPSQIQQIVMNLVINAADAIGGVPGTITISTESREVRAEELSALTLSGNLPSGPYVLIEVRDTGCGMTEEVKARIFDPMFTTKVKGRGLGLAAAVGIIRSHRGALNVQTRRGVGTIFTVYFPASLEGAEPNPDSSGKGDLWGTGTVLVIDDEPSVRKLAEATLTRYGYQVLSAADGAEGVAIYRTRVDEISLIIMDLSMPVMTGDEAFEQMLAISPKPPVLFSSGFNESETMKRREGYRFLQKPYTSRQLAEEVRSFLNGTLE